MLAFPLSPLTLTPAAPHSILGYAVDAQADTPQLICHVSFLSPPRGSEPASDSLSPAVNPPCDHLVVEELHIEIRLNSTGPNSSQLRAAASIGNSLTHAPWAADFSDLVQAKLSDLKGTQASLGYVAHPPYRTDVPNGRYAAQYSCVGLVLHALQHALSNLGHSGEILVAWTAKQNGYPEWTWDQLVDVFGDHLAKRKNQPMIRRFLGLEEDSARGDNTTWPVVMPGYLFRALQRWPQNRGPFRPHDRGQASL